MPGVELEEALGVIRLALRRQRQRARYQTLMSGSAERRRRHTLDIGVLIVAAERIGDLAPNDPAVREAIVRLDAADRLGPKLVVAIGTTLVSAAVALGFWYAQEPIPSAIATAATMTQLVLMGAVVVLRGITVRSIARGLAPQLLADGFVPPSNP